MKTADARDALEKRLGYVFRNRQLLSRALTHPSCEGVSQGTRQDNQRLEFLGDAVLQLCVSDALYARFPEMREGQLTRRRAALVCEANLAALATHLRLGEMLRMSAGEEALGGRTNPSILGDAMEAVIAAIWLDGGYDRISSLINGWMDDFTPRTVIDRDAKSALQEYLQSMGEKAPIYEILSEEGPPHARTFVARVLRETGEEMGRGTGSRKQRAEEAAAAEAMRALKDREIAVGKECG